MKTTTLPTPQTPVSTVIFRLAFLGGLLLISGFGLLFFCAQCIQWLK